MVTHNSKSNLPLGCRESVENLLNLFKKEEKILFQRENKDYENIRLGQWFEFVTLILRDTLKL